MATIKQQVRQTTGVQRVDEGAENYLRLLRDGTVGIADLIAQWSLEGRIFTVGHGAATTPVTFAAGALATEEMDLHIAVPAGVVIIPLEWDIHIDVFGGTAAIVECCLQYGTGSTVGVATTDVPPSSNANTGRTSACVCKTGSASGTALTAVVNEFWHDGNQLSITIASATQIRSQDHFMYRAMDSGVLQIIGPSQQLVGFCATNAGCGFFQFRYVELPVASVK